ncbi:GL16543 [Drosophila persimilis]|uniref:GL16543 n=1 Tax=Drosophila persimilis TaxID=7234 RepID=B4GWF3_DROPE|nr:GL16543 [Drosophila persimilis]
MLRTCLSTIRAEASEKDQGHRHATAGYPRLDGNPWESMIFDAGGSRRQQEAAGDGTSRTDGQTDRLPEEYPLGQPPKECPLAIGGRRWASAGIPLLQGTPKSRRRLERQQIQQGARSKEGPKPPRRHRFAAHFGVWGLGASLPLPLRLRRDKWPPPLTNTVKWLRRYATEKMKMTVE